MKPCRDCGKSFKPQHSASMYCDACSTEEKKRLRQKKYVATHKANGGYRKDEIINEAKRKAKRRPVVSLTETAVLAAAAGMSYGQYVAMGGGG